jgi:hypothetical protein
MRVVPNEDRDADAVLGHGDGQLLVAAADGDVQLAAGSGAADGDGAAGADVGAVDLGLARLRAHLPAPGQDPRDRRPRGQRQQALGSQPVSDAERTVELTAIGELLASAHDRVLHLDRRRIRDHIRSPRPIT